MPQSTSTISASNVYWSGGVNSIWMTEEQMAEERARSLGISTELVGHYSHTILFSPYNKKFPYWCEECHNYLNQKASHDLKKLWGEKLPGTKLKYGDRFELDF